MKWIEDIFVFVGVWFEVYKWMNLDIFKEKENFFKWFREIYMIEKSV